jgi:putative ABC transport system permease protein
VLLFRRDYFDELNGATGKVILFFIKVDRSDAIPEVIRSIDERFANSSFETETEAEVTVARAQVQSYRLLFRGAEYFAVVVIFVIGLVAANTAAMSVRERRNEIAVMRSIGYTRAAMVALFIAEGAAMGIAGGAFGTGLAWAVLTTLPHVTSGQGLFPLLKLLPWVGAESFAIATAIGVASAAVPALAATRGDIAAELRAL